MDFIPKIFNIINETESVLFLGFWNWNSQYMIFWDSVCLFKQAVARLSAVGDKGGQYKIIFKFLKSFYKNIENLQ